MTGTIAAEVRYRGSGPQELRLRAGVTPAGVGGVASNQPRRIRARSARSRTGVTRSVPTRARHARASAARYTAARAREPHAAAVSPSAAWLGDAHAAPSGVR